MEGRLRLVFKSHEEKLINECFERLGIKEKSVPILKMVHGGSGAMVAELFLQDRKMILKYTSSDAGVELYRNAQRERRFYKYGASQINIQSPTVVAEFEDSSFGIGLLMRSYQQTPHPSEWGHHLIIQSLTQISKLHAMFWGKDQEIYRITGEATFQPKFEYQQDEVAKSIEAWGHVYSIKNLDEFAITCKDNIMQLMRNLELLESFQAGHPSTLIHGDFHMENCLLDEKKEVMIVDWQSPKAGAGAEDVGNFLARAELYGNPLSANEYITLYKQLLKNQLHVSVPLDEIDQICHAKRLLLHLFWSPRYVLYYPDHVFIRVLEAIQESSLALGIHMGSGSSK
ncbi:phosphotransferase [Paenibacillus guangzhouensis]|uniref:phosphotransferase n=1 Tax=Paenibacillus guangzhouensis TaxID=1473112 RepID=UPI001266CAE8|nr:phosphotransferase [Paenibacillus guangzhouensis]